MTAPTRQTRTSQTRTSQARTRPTRTDVRERVLTAAHQTFLTKGYAETTIAEIAGKAGFTKGAVYSNFGSKPELFGEVCQEQFAVKSSSLLVDLGPTLQRTPADRLPQSLARSLAAVVSTHGRWLAAIEEFRALATRDADISTVYARIRSSQVAELTAILIDHEVLGEDSEQAYAEVAVIVLTQLTSLALEHAAAPRAVTAELIDRCLVRLIRGLLR
ncbi:TetR/AcrR family transcriptional regulator [Propionibacteriaceae bacterium Y1685]|uniref:TetR/AcrR family transcriptional regulator n=1 Tax=Microlunatus sp. Y1700 TaxID=3418487 RepID=UPI003B811372